MRRPEKFSQKAELAKAKARIYAPPAHRPMSVARAVVGGAITFLVAYATLVLWLLAGTVLVGQ